MHIQRLFKRSGQLRRFKRQLSHGHRIARVGPQIPFTLAWSRHQRRTTGQVNHNIAGRACAIASLGQHLRPAPCRFDHLQAINLNVEPTQRAPHLTDLPEDGVIRPGGHRLGIIGNQSRHRQDRAKPVRHRLHHLSRPHNETDAFADHIHRRRLWRRQQRFGRKRRHLRPCVPLSPSGTVPQVDKSGQIHAHILGQRLKRGAFLLTGNHHLAFAQGSLGRRQLAGAKRSMNIAAAYPAPRFDRGYIQVLRPGTVAQNQ